MFVGRIIQLEIYPNVVDLECAGAAIGGLGRHTQIRPDGMPIFDDRVEVTFKVGANDLNLLFYLL